MVPYDKTNREILRVLQRDARLTWAEVGRQVGLSGPAVAERVRRMEEAGVLLGYRAEVALSRWSHPVTAFVRIRTSADRYGQLTRLLEAEPGVIECHHVTGPESFVCKVTLESLPRLDEFLALFEGIAETTTNVVLSTSIEPRPVPLPPSRD